MAPIGIAILGGGIWVKEQHIPAVLATQDLVLRAIYSRSLKSAQDSASQISDPGVTPSLYADDAGSGRDLAAVLARDDISAVIIALPITAQPRYVEAALSAGKHVLAEKPIAPDVAGAKKLMAFYEKIRQEKSVTFTVAENFRFIPKFHYAREQIAKLGKITGFTVRVFSLQAKGNKWYNTPWRTKPDYQGGFVLDGGVHSSAAFRLLLGADAAPATVLALTTQTQEHLPPLDTVHALVTTKSGAIGTFSISQGTTLTGTEYAVACEAGSVTVTWGKVTVVVAGAGAGAERQEHVEEFPSDTNGVKELVAAWAAGLAAGKAADPLQSPELAVGDLELLEKMFRSGEAGGAPQTLELQ